jgi:hypothetical protein
MENISSSLARTLDILLIQARFLI